MKDLKFRFSANYCVTKIPVNKKKNGNHALPHKISLKLN